MVEQAHQPIGKHDDGGDGGCLRRVTGARHELGNFYQKWPASAGGCQQPTLLSVGQRGICEMLSGIRERTGFRFQPLSEHGHKVSRLAHSLRPGIMVVGRKLLNVLGGCCKYANGSFPAESGTSLWRGTEVQLAAPDLGDVVVPSRVQVVPSGAQFGQ